MNTIIDPSRSQAILRHATRRKEEVSFNVIALESRLLFCLDGHLGDHDGHELVGSPLPNDPAVLAPADIAGSSSGATGAVAVTGGVPLLSSNPTARAKLYLDFDGDAATNWGSYNVSATPAYDNDGNASSFSDAELSNIAAIWARIAEKYAPFNIDVTTVNPGSLTDKVALRVVIGGNGSWAGGTYGGLAYVGGFYNSASNTVYSFSANLGGGAVSYTAESIAHESGHGFGLQHQSSYSGSTKTAEYNMGDSLIAPILGNSYYAQRGVWWYGASLSSTSIQDDMAVLAGTNNGFGYRVDDHASGISGAGALSLSGSTLSGSGIVERMSDADYFSFTTAGGRVSFTGSVIAQGATLDLKLELRSASGALIAVADTASLGETLSADLAAGTYYLVVASHGAYGDVGQYSVSGAVTLPEGFLAGPTNLTAAALSSTQVSLSWLDQSSNETGFAIQRSTDGGATWSTLATLAANSTAYMDAAAYAGGTFHYRVQALSSTTQSSYSNLASATTVPLAPSSLVAAALSGSQIKLTWSDVSGETGYRLERSIDGVSGWVSVYTSGANITSFTDNGLSNDTSYFYRVTALGQTGSSDYSPVASARTPVQVVLQPPAAPMNLTAAMVSKNKARLTWMDASADETGFVLQRSSNGGATWSTLATLPANSSTYTDSGLRRGTTYMYRIAAYNSGGTSVYSSAASARASDTPAEADSDADSARGKSDDAHKRGLFNDATGVSLLA